jgi:hypothetical protein
VRVSYAIAWLLYVSELFYCVLLVSPSRQIDSFPITNWNGIAILPEISEIVFLTYRTVTTFDNVLYFYPSIYSRIHFTTNRSIIKACVLGCFLFVNVNTVIPVQDIPRKVLEKLFQLKPR